MAQSLVILAAARAMTRCAALVLCLLATASLASAAAPAPSGWQAVLVAGDDAQPVFNNAVAAFDRWLRAQGVPESDIHRLAAHPTGPAEKPASNANVLGQISGLRPEPGQACLVFMTSHGKQDDGVWLANRGEFLWAVSLARALGDGCRTAPTVVIVSACYSGDFATGSMQAPNRIILTAARGDRPSFGCEADRRYTVFDQCLLGALRRARGWQLVYRDELACVHKNEHRMRVLASHPQAFFGAEARSLPVP